MESMWEHEDQPHWRDYLMAVFFASFFPVARLFLDSIIFEVNCEMLTTFNALKVGHIISKLMEVPIKRQFPFNTSLVLESVTSIQMLTISTQDKYYCCGYQDLLFSWYVNLVTEICEKIAILRWEKSHEETIAGG